MPGLQVHTLRDPYHKEWACGRTWEAETEAVAVYGVRWHPPTLRALHRVFVYCGRLGELPRGEGEGGSGMRWERVKRKGREERERKRKSDRYSCG